jgi:hypothetical protein
VAGPSKHVRSRSRLGNTVLVIRGFSLNPERSAPEPGEASAGVPTAGGVEALLEELDQTEVRDDKEHQHAVRMTKMTSVCVSSDSMNQPARNSSGPARKTHSITPNVRKS